MLNFPQNQVIPKNQQEREHADLLEKQRRDLFQTRISENLKKGFNVAEIREIPLNVFPISQKHSIYSNMPYGKIGTVGEAGCGPLAVEYAFRLMGIYVRFEEILEQCVEKGYRAYIYNEQGEIIDGSGTEDTLFANLANEIDSVAQMLDFIKKGCPVTILVINSIYYSNPNSKGNHFMTLVGVDEQENAIMMDGNLIKNNPSEALVKMKLKQILPGIRSAWAWEKNMMEKLYKK